MTNKYIPGHVGSSLHTAHMQYRILLDYPFVYHVRNDINENTGKQINKKKKWRISSSSRCVFLYFVNFRLMKTKRK